MGKSLRIVLGILPNVQKALSLTESLIASGCAAHSIFLLMTRESRGVKLLEDDSLLVSIAEHLGTGFYCIGDPRKYAERVFDRAVQQRRCFHLIDRFATHYPNDWEFHLNHVRAGSPVGVVHLEEDCHDEPTIARTVLNHAVKRLQISDFPKNPACD